jgi:2-polyprenyl-6-hydroxyphenyl methylase/3-demethylubiquinone-9 3-methyltransferase
MEHTSVLPNYRYADGDLNDSHGYLLPAVIDILASSALRGQHLFELGCGNGSVAAELTKRGYDVVGIDASREAIEQANRHHPSLKLEAGSAYDALSAKYGQFPMVLSLEVVEHLYTPRQYAASVYDLLLPGGVAIISTPYHSYWKNLALALTGKLDAHFTALWDHGHIKFWSMETLGALLTEAGFVNISFRRVGRVPVLGKSMIAVARKGSACPSRP